MGLHQDGWREHLEVYAATSIEDQREHGKECSPVTAASIGRKDQEPDTKHNGDDMVSTEANTNPSPDRGFVTQQA